MPELSDLQRDVIIRLKLDPSAQREGYAQAKQIQRQASSEMLAIDAERQRIRGQLEAGFSQVAVNESKKRMAAINTEMTELINKARQASTSKAALYQQEFVALSAERDAIKQEIAGYDALKNKLGELNAKYREQAAVRKEGQIAAGGFQQTAGAQNPWACGGNERVLSGFTPEAMMQTLGLGVLGAGLPMVPIDHRNGNERCRVQRYRVRS